jgi:hypothetical protein
VAIGGAEKLRVDAGGLTMSGGIAISYASGNGANIRHASGGIDVWTIGRGNPSGYGAPAGDTTVFTSLGNEFSFLGNVFAYRYYANSTAYLDGANAGRIGVTGSLDSHSVTAGGAITMTGVAGPTYGRVVTDTVYGLQLGTGATQKLAFYGATPVVQRASADQAAAPAGGTGTAAGGYDTAAHRDAMINLVNEMRTVLVSLGLMKGSA